MAVPKKKQSKSRRDKRRAQHKISPSALSTCSQCKSRRRPHRVCTVCGTYAGRQVVVETVKEPKSAAEEQPE